MRNARQFEAYLVELIRDSFNGHMEHGDARPIARELADKIIETLLANPELIDTFANAINSTRQARMLAKQRERTG